MSDRRKHERIAARIGASARTEGRPALSCTVRDRSAGGVGIRTERPDLLPQRFELDLPARSTTFDVRVRWRTADAAGLEFASRARTSAPSRDGSFRTGGLERARGALRAALSRPDQR